MKLLHSTSLLTLILPTALTSPILGAKVSLGLSLDPLKWAHSLPGAPPVFTSSYKIKATPDQVVDNTNTKTGGLAGAQGCYEYAINKHLDIICYQITLTGFRGEYQSPARTATHIHQAARGLSGPPRIAFPNPKDDGKGIRRSAGCLKGPFATGVLANGVDTGAGFKVAAIEENPAGFFTDVHSSLAVPGAVRGQLA